MRARLAVLGVCLWILPGVAAAGPVRPPDRSAPVSQPPPVRNDSKWNGALIGAGLGALAGAFFGSAAIECSECAGFNVPVTFGVIGAGAGAAIGIGIDAHFHQRSPGSNPPARTRRVSVVPVMARSVKGVVASVRF